MLCVITSLVLTGCSTRSSNIQASYVSPLVYQSYSCEQIEQEEQRIARRVSEVSTRQDSRANSDAVAVVASVIVWPALFFLASGDLHEEVARLKGEYEALQQVAVQKNCSIKQQ